ncbi:hypothetical protein P7C71_g4292, partial [Lecanoromycetidae sp. Uapishka_2]
MARLSSSILFVLAVIILRLVYSVIQYRHHQAKALRRGCGSLPALPRKDPLGFVRIFKLLKAKREQNFLPFVAALFDSAGHDVYTVSDRLMGRNIIWTRDPENMRAILTSQVKDFDIGVARVGSLGPLIGNGIFLNSNEAWRHSRTLLRPQFARVQRYAQWYVKAALQRKKFEDRRANPVTKTKFDLIDELVNVSQNEEEIRNESLNVLGAGRSTTAALLGWVFYHLARHPTIYDKLRKVILAQFGTFEDPRDITFENLKGCQYLHCCINETFRRTPNIPFNIREALRDTTLPTGGGPHGSQPVFVPKGTEIYLSYYPVNMRTDIWGDDVEDFRPERFEGRKFSWAFTPFGAGQRSCMGQQFALTEAAYLLVRFLQRYDKMENLEEPGPIRYNYMISSRSGTGVQVRLHKC